MNLNKLSSAKESAGKPTGMSKSTNEIAKLISNEYLKELELNEYCKIAESDFTKYQEKFHDLMNNKNQSVKTKAEYKSRNKINITNSESLIKALNELHKYKCELKLGYVTVEKELKLKKLKYKKIISGYESAWNETLKKYNKTSVIAELLKIQKENQILEREIDKQVKLLASTKSEFTQLKENTEQNFFKKVVNFSKFMIQHTKSLSLQERNEKKQSHINRSFDFRLFRAETPLLQRKNLLGIENTEDGNIYSSIDVTIFDDLMIPSENLESQQAEEDSYCFLSQQTCEISGDREEGLQYLKNQQETKNKKQLKDPNEVSVQDTIVEENESRYFRQQPAEVRKEPEENVNQKNIENKSSGNSEDKLKSKGAVLQQGESEDETPKDIQMECEESLSQGSDEKQYCIQREIYDCQKTSSMSSDDPPGENANESTGSVPKPCEDQQNKTLKPRTEIESSELKSFPGFFTMGSENDNPTPSIFKLF